MKRYTFESNLFFCVGLFLFPVRNLFFQEFTFCSGVLEIGRSSSDFLWRDLEVVRLAVILFKVVCGSFKIIAEAVY